MQERRPGNNRRTISPTANAVSPFATWQASAGTGLLQQSQEEKARWTILLKVGRPSVSRLQAKGRV